MVLYGVIEFREIRGNLYQKFENRVEWRYMMNEWYYMVLNGISMALYGINELESCSAIYIKNLRTVSNAREWCC